MPPLHFRAPAGRAARRAARRAFPLVLAVGAVLLTAGLLSAHDFWIVPDAFQIASGGALSARGQSSGRFPTSGSATAPDRIAEARIVGATTDERITDLSVSGTSLMIRHRPTAVGQRVVALALASRTTRVTPAQLKRYIALEGAPELAERYEREKGYPTADSVDQIAAKFAKAVVEIGTGGPRAYAKPVGHALELVPVTDPSALRAGDTLAVRLVYHGKSVPNAYLRAGAAPPGVTATGEAPPRPAPGAPADARKDVIIATDADGVARVPVGVGGLWNVRTLHAAARPNDPRSWELYFATLVFNVSGARGAAGGEVERVPTRAARVTSDSADVVAAVARFHASLAAGDSAAALAALTDDVTILESGEAQTRDAYRAHHLAADIAYARAVPSVNTVGRVVVAGDAAWVSATSVTRGQYNGREVNSAGAELVVLTRAPRAPHGWSIRAIHWSSRRAPAKTSP